MATKSCAAASIPTVRRVLKTASRSIGGKKGGIPNGHSRESVEETIRTCAPTIRETQTGRNWQRYAERTADYAFGPAGDRDLERNERYRKLWRMIEGLEEKERASKHIKMR